MLNIPLIAGRSPSWLGSGIVAFDFANNLYYGGAALADLAITRASTAFAENLDGTLTSFSSNVLRRTNKGLLVEPAATNITLQSQNLENAAYNKSTVTVTQNDAVAPDGTTTAEKLTPAASAELFYVQPVVSAAVYTFSLWVKSATGGNVSTSLFTNGSGVTPNPQAATPFTATTAWQRLSKTVQGAGVATANFGIGNVGTGGNNFSVGEDLHSWGWQIELGSTASSYIPTTTVAVTRAADAITIANVRGATRYVFTFSDDTKQEVTGVTNGYAIPTTLNGRVIKRMVGYA